MKALGSDVLVGHAEGGDPVPWIDLAQPVYALVDPIAGDIGPLAAKDWGAIEAGELMQSRALAWQRFTWLVPTPRAAQLRPCAQPYLVMLTGLEDPWLAYFVELAQAELQQVSEPDGLGVGAHACAGFLQCGASPELLTDHLSELFRLPPGTTHSASYLRLADRRTLSLSLHTLGAQRFAQTLGPISQWTYLGVLGHWRRIRSDSTTQTLCFSPEQWAQMELGATIHPPISRVLGDSASCAAMRTGDESLALSLALNAAKRSLGWQAARRRGALSEGDARDLIFRLLRYSEVQTFEQTLAMVDALVAANAEAGIQEHLLVLDEQMSAQAMYSQ